MRKERFVYNTQTLQYERVVVPLRSRILQGFSIFCALGLFALIAVVIADAYLDSPQKKLLRQELSQMNAKYTILNEQMTVHEKVLGNLQDRDAFVHRMIFGMDPIDGEVWNGGTGGRDKYNHLKGKVTGATMKKTAKRIDKLSRQLALQSKSLDSIIVLVQEKEKMLASIPSIKPVREDKLNRKMHLMSGFGKRLHPIHKVVKMHTGIDFAAPVGTPIISTGNGTVIRVLKQRTGYGRHVVIDHGYGHKSLYGHMHDIDVKVGQEVMKGEQIGTVGNTGTSTAPHLHYEIIKGNRKVNPIHFCMDGLSPDEYQEMVEHAAVSNQSFD